MKTEQQFFEGIYNVTIEDQNVNDTNSLFRHTMEEVGEIATALSVQSGDKFKTLVEDAKSETVDLLLCVASLWFEANLHNDSDWMKLVSRNTFSQESPEFILARIAKRICDGFVAASFGISSDAIDYYQDAVELTIELCIRLGGTPDEIITIGEQKLAKWLLCVRKKAALAT